MNTSILKGITEHITYKILLRNECFFSFKYGIEYHTFSTQNLENK